MLCDAHATIFAGTKSDLSTERETTRAEIMELVERWDAWEPAGHLETSAKTGENVLALFEAVVRLHRRAEAGRKTQKRGKRCSIL